MPQSKNKKEATYKKVHSGSQDGKVPRLAKQKNRNMSQSRLIFRWINLVPAQSTGFIVIGLLTLYGITYSTQFQPEMTTISSEANDGAMWHLTTDDKGARLCWINLYSVRINKAMVGFSLHQLTVLVILPAHF